MSDVFVTLVRPPSEVDSGGQVAWFVIRSAELLVTEDGEFPVGSAADVGADGDDQTEEPVFLGLLGGVPAWAVGVGPGVEPPDGMRFDQLRALSGRLPERSWTLAARAVQLVEWGRTHRFCGRCGQATEPSPGERAKRCPACGLLAFPRLAPAVITLVERGDEVLLANGRAFGVPMYSCLAGFVEPGESLEEAVRREVAEEVGVSLGEVRYFASQPWPFPHSLMVGFNATWASGDIEIGPGGDRGRGLVSCQRHAAHPARRQHRPMADRRMVEPPIMNRQAFTVEVRSGAPKETVFAATNTNGLRPAVGNAGPGLPG